MTTIQNSSKQRDVVRVMARGIETICHPLLVTLWMALLVVSGSASGLNYPPVIQAYVLSNIIFMTLVIPLVFLFLLRLFGRRPKAEETIAGRRERVMMLAVVALSALGCGWIFADVMVLFLLRKMLYTAAAVALIVLIFEFFYPLDHYTTAFGALLGMVWVLLYVGTTSLLAPFIVGIVLCGLLFSSRLYTSQERVGSILWGLVIGALFSAIIFILS